MQIREEHFYHGAALIQIAEHPQFTAINSQKVNGKVSRSAYKINDTISVYLKYATKPKGTFKEFQFNFTTQQMDEMKSIVAAGDKLFIALVCGGAKEICCLPYTQLLKFVRSRDLATGTVEDQYQVLVTLVKAEAFRVYVNQPGKRKMTLGTPLKITRNRFPTALFSS